MTVNPLMNRAPSGDAEARLHMHVAELNALNWVHDSGKPYFVAKRDKANGRIEHYVDRAI